MQIFDKLFYKYNFLLFQVGVRFSSFQFNNNKVSQFLKIFLEKESRMNQVVKKWRVEEESRKRRTKKANKK